MSVITVKEYEDSTDITTIHHWSRNIITVFHQKDHRGIANNIHVNYSSGGVNKDTDPADLCYVMADAWIKANQIVMKWKNHNKETLEKMKEEV